MAPESDQTGYLRKSYDNCEVLGALIMVDCVSGRSVQALSGGAFQD